MTASTTTGRVGENKLAGQKSRKKRAKLSLQSVGGIISIVGFAIAWQIASYYAPAYAVPSWQRIGAEILNIPPYDVTISVARLLASMMLSFIIGLAVSTTLFERPLLESLVLPFVKLLMAVPAVCWVVFSILWFKGVEFRIFFVMCVTCMPVFILDSHDAMKSVPRELREMGKSFRPGPIQYVGKIIFPAIVPNLLTSWKINLTLAVRVVTIAELVGAVSGIGHGLVLAQEAFSVAEVFAWTMVLVAILLVLQGLVMMIENRALAWRVA
jgi:NitT/TauT family transport system permease protein